MNSDMDEAPSHKLDQLLDGKSLICYYFDVFFGMISVAFANITGI